MIFYFVPGIILGHFRHPKSIFRYRTLEFLCFFAKCVFDLKIDFLIKRSISRFKKTKKTLKNTGKNWKNPENLGKKVKKYRWPQASKLSSTKKSGFEFLIPGIGGLFFRSLMGGGFDRGFLCFWGRRHHFLNTTKNDRFGGWLRPLWGMSQQQK